MDFINKFMFYKYKKYNTAISGIHFLINHLILFSLINFTHFITKWYFIISQCGINRTLIRYNENKSLIIGVGTTSNQLLT